MDDGKVHVFATSGTAGDAALQMIRDVTATAEIGKTYLGKVVRLADFGAFVEIFPGTDGLLHISEVAEHRIKDVRDELKEGDQILVKVLSVEGNRIRLSRKAILKEQRAKMGGGAGPGSEPEIGETRGETRAEAGGRAGDGGGSEPSSAGGSVVFEGGGDYAEAEEGEPNFNRVETARP